MDLTTRTDLVRDLSKSKELPVSTGAALLGVNRTSIYYKGIPISEEELECKAIIDWYSRCIVGWEVDDTLDTSMVIRALEKAFLVARPEILNSNQGCQFTSQRYIDFLKANGVRQSMDGKSRWADNIMIERWFRTFKYDEAYLTQYANIREARSCIARYIHTYNFERCHSAIGHRRPAEVYYPALLYSYVA